MQTNFQPVCARCWCDCYTEYHDHEPPDADISGWAIPGGQPVFRHRSLDGCIRALTKKVRELEERNNKMQITEVSYKKVKNLGNYSNEQLECTVTVNDRENADDALNLAKQFVENGLREKPTDSDVRRAEQKVRNPDEYTGREVKEARELLKWAEEVGMEVDYSQF